MSDFTIKTVDFMIKKFVKDPTLDRKVTDPTLRKKYAYLEAWVSIVGNFVLALIKVLLGLMLNSISLLADAAHTASDVLTSVVVLLGFKISSSPADKKHPYGHGRVEFIASLIISVMLLFIGIEFGKSSYTRLTANVAVKGSYVVALIMVLGALLKEWMARFSVELGTRTDSSALIADAWHHRTDGIASILVAVAIVASQFGYYRVDAIFGLLVSALIIYTGISIAIDSTSKLIGEVPEDEVLKDIENTALQVAGVSGVHKINIYNYGSYEEICLHVQVEDDFSLVKAHDISEEVERVIEEKTNSRVTVHVEPLSDLAKQ
jgi:cation diffusion facilitator family transporter